MLFNCSFALYISSMLDTTFVTSQIDTLTSFTLRKQSGISIVGDLEKTIMLEVSALSSQRLSVSLEHPLEESIVTVELDLSDVIQPTCKIYTTAGDTSPEYASKVFQRLVASSCS